MSKWIRRWVKRVRRNFPDCAVRCNFNRYYFGYVLQVYYPKYQAWQVSSTTNTWHTWGILLNPSPSPAVWQNRKLFREHFDYALRREINTMTMEKED